MNRNVKANQVSEDWTVIFLQSVLMEFFLYLSHFVPTFISGSYKPKDPQNTGLSNIINKILVRDRHFINQVLRATHFVDGPQNKTNVDIDTFL